MFLAELLPEEKKAFLELAYLIATIDEQCPHTRDFSRELGHI